MQNLTDERGDVWINDVNWDERVTINQPRTIGFDGSDSDRQAQVRTGRAPLEAPFALMGCGPHTPVVCHTPPTDEFTALTMSSVDTLFAQASDALRNQDAERARDLCAEARQQDPDDSAWEAARICTAALG